MVGMRQLPCAALALVVAHAAAAFAQESEADRAFRQGRELMRAGRVAEACARFEASQRLDPAPGTLLNLGDCWERLGRDASAWTAFLQAAATATRPEHTDEARKRSARLAPRVNELVASAMAWKALAWAPPVRAAPIAVLPPPEPPRPARAMTPLTWSLAGAGAAAVAVGLVVGASAWRDLGACRDRGTCATNEEVDGIHTRFVAGDVLVGVGLASAGAAGLFYCGVF